MAPEINENKIYDGKKTDVFALGVIIFMICVGNCPFQAAKRSNYFYNILMSKNYDQYWQKTGSEHLSQELKELLTKMLSYNPYERPSISQVINHPWMVEVADC